MRGEGQFIRGTIKYKKIVYLILFLLVAVGVYGLAVINKDEFPTFEIKEGLVVGVYPGASAAEVEAQLTKPLEDLLFSFSEVDRGSCSYSQDGICYISRKSSCCLRGCLPWPCWTTSAPYPRL